jgi:hypothetical protein
VTKRCPRGQPDTTKMNDGECASVFSNTLGTFVLDENKQTSREVPALFLRSERVRAFACVLLESTFRPTQASASLPRTLHSKPVGRLRASPRKLRFPLPTPCVPRARTARTLALLADCAHACDPRADANDSRKSSYYGSGHAGQGPRAKIVVCDPSRFTPPLDAHVCSARPPAERHDGTMHEHVQRTTHRRSTLGAGTLSRVGEHESSRDV